jgi:hypothetical protein
MMSPEVGSYNIFGPEKLGMGFPTEVIDITKYPLTIGLLCAIGAMVITKDLSNLVQ